MASNYFKCEPHNGDKVCGNSLRVRELQLTCIRDFVNSIIAANGGQAAYDELEAITVKWHFTGATLAIKGKADSLFPTTTIYTKEQKVIHRGLGGDADEEWTFTPSRVWKQRISDGRIIESRDDPFAAFKGHTLQTPWDDLHFIYFAGVANWQYYNFPFTLNREDVSTKELEPHQENGQTWRVLEVTYPEQAVLATHVRTQKYYFDQEFALQRHDYAPDTLANTPAAQYVYDEVVVGGIKFPTRRRIIAINPANGVPLYHGPIPTLISIFVSSIELQKEESAGSKWALVEAPRV